MNKVQNIFIPPMHLKRRVVAEFDQGATAEYAEFPGGFCAGLTLNWLNMRLRNQDWPATQADGQTAINATTGAITYRSYKKFQEGRLKEMSVPNVVTRAIGGSDSIGLIESVPVSQLRAAIESVAGGLRLAIDGEVIVWKEGVDGHVFMHEAVVLGVGLYYLSMTAKMPAGDDQAHAVGLHIYGSSTDTDCEFFDPNLGQFHFENPLDLRWAFFDLMKAYTAAYGFTFYRGALFRMKKAF